MRTPKTLHKLFTTFLLAVLMWQCEDSTNSESRITISVPDPGRDGVAEVVLAGYDRNFTIPLVLSVSDAEGIERVALAIQSPAGESIWEPEALRQGPYQWEWEASYLENGLYQVLISVWDGDGELTFESFSIDLLTRYYLQFTNYSPREATLFIGGNTIVASPSTSSDSVIVNGGIREISMNIQDWPPYPYFNAETITIRRNSELELYMNSSEDGFYYLVRP